LRIEYNNKIHGASVISKRNFAPGEVIYKFRNCRVTNIPTYQTIQIGENEHIVDLDIMAYLNHSCMPNTFIDTKDLSVIAARLIVPGEDLTIFYPSTEWEMAKPFICQCKEPDCLGLIAGAKYLLPEVLNRYHISLHISQMACFHRLVLSGK
jgi:hypothetical protein